MEANENQLHPNTNRKEGFSLRKSSKFLTCEVLTTKEGTASQQTQQVSSFYSGTLHAFEPLTNHYLAKPAFIFFPSTIKIRKMYVPLKQWKHLPSYNTNSEDILKLDNHIFLSSEDQGKNNL